ncbi:MAG: hypothetical protein Q7T16_03560 [Candidatus Burarchaeum sp.]|nr:hypothetical protein [Candidatus Burarchaeum sp.]MDO8339708.1 hypothetical protein [Candidatus Burarchaeum sp.]
MGMVPEDLETGPKDAVPMSGKKSNRTSGVSNAFDRISDAGVFWLFGLVMYAGVALAIQDRDSRANTYHIGFKQSEVADVYADRAGESAVVNPDVKILVINLYSGEERAIRLSGISGITVRTSTNTSGKLDGVQPFADKAPDEQTMQVILSTRSSNPSIWRSFVFLSPSPSMILEFKSNAEAERLIEQLESAIRQGSIVLDKAKLEEEAMSSLKERPVRAATMAKLNGANKAQQWENGWRAVNGGTNVHPERTFRNPATGAVKQVQGPQLRKTPSA